MAAMEFPIKLLSYSNRKPPLCYFSFLELFLCQCTRLYLRLCRHHRHHFDDNLGFGVWCGDPKTSCPSWVWTYLEWQELVNSSIWQQPMVVVLRCNRACPVWNCPRVHGSTNYCSYCQQERAQTSGMGYFYTEVNMKSQFLS